MNIRRHLIMLSALFLTLFALAKGFSLHFDREADGLHAASHLIEHQAILAERIFRGVDEIILSNGSPDSVQLVNEAVAAFEQQRQEVRSMVLPDPVRLLTQQVDHAWREIQGRIDPLSAAKGMTVSSEKMMQEHRILRDTTEGFIALVAGTEEVTTRLAHQQRDRALLADNLALSIIVIGVLFLFFDLYRQVALPIRRLRNEMERLSFGPGDFQLRLHRVKRPVGDSIGVSTHLRNSEVMVLARSFDRLLEHIRNYLRERTMALEYAHRVNQELEQRVAERAAELDRIVNLSRDLLCIVQMDGRFKSVNPAFSETLGYPEQEFLSRPFLEFIHPDDVQPSQAEFSLHQQREDYETIDFENRWRRSDGSYCWLQWRAVMNEDMLYAVARDVTEQKKLSHELRQTAAVFENTTEAVVITDADAKVLAVNRAFSDITGYRPEEALGNTPSMWRSQRQERDFYKELRAAIKKTGAWRGEIWNRRKDGDVFPALLTINAVRDERGGVTNYIAVMADISMLKSTQERFEHLAHHDPLTDLPNRLLFNARLEHALEHAKREKQQVAVMFIDLDNFKAVNDTLGHPMGDRLLQEVARRLSSSLREQDTVARVAGDEFSVILEEVKQHEDAMHVAEKLLDAFYEPILLGQQELHTTLSIGISIFPGDGDNATMLVKNADAAMFRSKHEGRNRCSLYTPELTEAAAERLLIENDLRRAVKQKEFVVYYQPQYLLPSKRLVGAEALVRWNHPEQGMIAPDRFIPVAEESSLIVAIGEQVLRSACAQHQEWRTMGFDLQRISVNVAGTQIQTSDLVTMVEQVLAGTGMPPEKLELEVIESFIMQQEDQSISTLQSLRELGVGLAIDDFGTGHSSLSYLKMLPIDRLKIDRSFISDIPRDQDDVAITRAILAMAKSLELQVVAEGVESEEQLQFLQLEGCQEAQGYYFSRPLPAEEFFRLLQAEQRRLTGQQLANLE